MSSSNISTEGAVQIDQDEPLVLDIVHSTISDTCENSLDVEKSTSNETLSTKEDMTDTKMLVHRYLGYKASKEMEQFLTESELRRIAHYEDGV